MKKRFVSLLSVIIFICLATACGRHIAPQKTVTQNVTYLCPMHKEVVSSQPGKCPKCGMDLVTFEEYRNSKSGSPTQNRMPDSHSGFGGSGGGHAGHH